MTDATAAVPSRQVSWWPVHEFLEQLLAQSNYGPIPDAGTPSWQQLGSDDLRKLLAIAVAGEHWVLRVETAQEQLGHAAKSIAEAADWPGVARRIHRGRGPAYIPRSSRTKEVAAP